MAEDKWYASGRDIFHRDAGFQLGAMVASVNWQEETSRFVRLLNAGESLDAVRCQGASASAARYRDGRWEVSTIETRENRAITATEFHAKWKNIPIGHSNTCERRGGFDYETCTCGHDELWDRRNADLQLVQDPENLASDGR
jgi:hypothetical protein